MRHNPRGPAAAFGGFKNMKKGNPIALLPIGVFLVLYLGLGILFEYGLKIPMGFYNIPIVVAFLAALLVACVQNRSLSFDDKLVLMGKGVGDKNIMIMILIFMTAGIFVGVVGRSSAESVAYCLLSLIPARYAVAVLFVVACFVSLAMGTFRGHHHPHHSHRPGGGGGIGLQRAPVRGLGDGERHVRGQPVLYL